MEDPITTVYGWIGGVFAVPTFFIIWWYAFTTWGFLVGLAIGWLPALIGATIAGALWPLALIGGVVFLLMGYA